MFAERLTRITQYIEHLQALSPAVLTAALKGGNLQTEKERLSDQLKTHRSELVDPDGKPRSLRS